MEAQVALKAAFSSPAMLYLIPLIFLLAITHRFPLGFRSDEFAGQSSTVTPGSANSKAASVSQAFNACGRRGCLLYIKKKGLYLVDL